MLRVHFERRLSKVHLTEQLFLPINKELQLKLLLKNLDFDEEHNFDKYENKSILYFFMIPKFDTFCTIQSFQSVKVNKSPPK